MTLTNRRFFELFIILTMIALAACSPVNGQLPDTGSGQALATATPANSEGQTSTPAPTSAAASGSEPALAGTHWKLASITAAGTAFQVPADANVTLNFDQDGQASGSAGCNSFGAQYQVNGNTLTISQVISTMMACTDTGIMQQEQQYLKALNLTGTFEQTPTSLTINFDQGAGTLNFIPASEPATPTPDAGLLCSFGSQAEPSGWDACRSLQYGFEIQYPAAADLVDNTAASARIDLPFTSGTNLTEKYLQIDAQANHSPCTSPLAEGSAPGVIPSETVQFNGLDFTKQTGQGAATGNRYDWTAYSISREGTCLSLSFVLHSFEPELQPTPPPRYDQAAESAIFDQIMQTFQWTATEATPTPNPVQPTPAPQRIKFASGATSASVSGRLPASGSDLYVLQAQQGQTMTVDLSFSQGQAILVVYGADGTVLMSDHAEASHFEGRLPGTQDYFIRVEGRPDGQTDYQMTVSIPPVSAGAPTPTPQLIHFAPGATSATVTGQLAASGSAIYKLYALKGQTMQLDLTASQGKAILVVWGEDGTVLQTDHTEVTQLERQLPVSQYYFIQVEGYPGGPTDYSLQVTIPPA